MKGIYKITNTSNNKIYIGKSQNIFKRWNTHMRNLLRNRHHNKELQKDFNSYGVNSFSFMVLEILSDDCTDDELSKLELSFIKKYNCKNIDVGYNFDQSNNTKMKNAIGEGVVRQNEIKKKRYKDEYGAMTVDEYIDSRCKWLNEFYSIPLNKNEMKEILILLEKKRNRKTYITLTEIGEKYGMDKSDISFINQTYIYVKNIYDEVKKWISSQKQEKN